MAAAFDITNIAEPVPPTNTSVVPHRHVIFDTFYPDISAPPLPKLLHRHSIIRLSTHGDPTSPRPGTTAITTSQICPQAMTRAGNGATTRMGQTLAELRLSSRALV